jgi:hypothetical protein
MLLQYMNKNNNNIEEQKKRGFLIIRVELVGNQYVALLNLLPGCL